MSVTEKELDFLFPEKDTEIAGQQFTLRPFSLHETFVVAEKLQNVLHLLTDDMSVSAIAKMIVSSRDGVEDIIAMSLGIDVKLVRKFDMMNAMKAVTAIVEVNRDFFFDCVSKELTALKEVAKVPESKPSAKRSSRS